MNITRIIPRIGVGASVALVIAASAVTFAVADAVLFRRLPYRDPARLVSLWSTAIRSPKMPVNYEEFRAVAAAKSFSAVAAYTPGRTTLGGARGQPVLVCLAANKVHKLVKCYAATKFPSIKWSSAHSNRCHATANGLRPATASGSRGSRVPKPGASTRPYVLVKSTATRRPTVVSW
jgi:hypothetical protein